MDRLAYVAAFIAAAAATYEGWRIREMYRQPGTFGIVGPDTYLLGLGIAVMLIAVASLVFDANRSRQPDLSPVNREEGVGVTAYPYIAATILYVLALLYFGYLVTTFAFFVAMFRIGSIGGILRIFLSSALATACFYLVFVKVAGLSFPSALPVLW